MPEINLPTVHFEFDRTYLTGIEKAILDSLIADRLQPDPQLRIGIYGHTDSEGTEQYNLSLSRRRAESVKHYLEAKGIDKERMETQGFGESMPLNDNKTAEDRAENRRVEFEILK